MTAVHNDHPLHHSGATVIDCRGAHLGAHTDAELTVMTISGEIDASNVDNMSRHIRELVLAALAH